MKNNVCTLKPIYANMLKLAENSTQVSSPVSSEYFLLTDYSAAVWHGFRIAKIVLIALYGKDLVKDV